MRASLSTKISIVFGIAFALVCILFITFGKIQTNQAFERMRISQINSIEYLISLYGNSMPPKDIEAYFRNFNLIVTKDKNLINNVLSSGEIVFTNKSPIGNFISLKYLNTLFLHVQNQSSSITLESIGSKNINDPLWIGFFATIALLISLYFSVMKSLEPLKKLNSNIKKFSSGDLDTSYSKIKGNDEIAEVAHEFDKAVLKIKELLTSRQLFLRTIMHELKTPIGKGRIVSEMIDDETQKARLVNVFERLEILINEFAKIEQLLSKSYSINFQECHFSLIIEQVKDMLMLDDWDKYIELTYEEDTILNVDFQLFALAIKNLIDNGLKYSNDKKVLITCTKERICIQNTGNPFTMSIEHYKQAFVRNKNEKVTGMGLGLHIVDEICNMHKFQFDHFYCQNMHNFCIIFNNKSENSCKIQKNKKIPIKNHNEK